MLRTVGTGGAERNRRISCRDTIYAIPISREQIKREMRNSIHTPSHAVALFAFLSMKFFKGVGVGSFVIALVLTAVWAEIWHYISHRAFHTQLFLAVVVRCDPADTASQVM